MEALTGLIRFALYLDLMALFGVAAFGLYGLRGGERRSGAALPFRPLLGGTAMLGLVLSALGLASLAAVMSGVPLSQVDSASIGMILTGTAVGAAWIARTAALAAALALALLTRARPRGALTGTAAAGAVALSTLTWAGHGAMDEGATGTLHLAADLLHLLTAGIWVGALLALVLLVFRRRDLIDRDHLLLSQRALAGFSLTGTITVAAILLSGLVNSWLLVGPANFLKLSESLYGQLLIAKLVLFAAMIALAAVNRFRLVPAFERSLLSADHGTTLRALRHSLAVETSCALAILALVAWLGMLEPPISAI